MIYASDLDRTLIYSNKFFKEFEECYIDNLIVAEYKDNKPISYASMEIENLLYELNKNITFIPVTTRIQHQFKRIDLFDKKVIPKYAVMCNGGVIVKDGVLLQSWDKIIKESLNKIPPLVIMMRYCNFLLNSSYIESYSLCEGLYLCAVLKDKNLLDNTLIQKAQSICLDSDYKLIIHGRKLYIIPLCINKYAPLKHIMDIENDYDLYSSGDSEFDFPMLLNSTVGMIPRHSSMKTELLDNHKNIYITENIGIKASEEILKKVLTIHHANS
ncbi:hypothetical protein [Clostridium faecium]|uniref:Haloacid dehalogenase-like hydrolase n=1 Tax=Clostridium faecium TaxID=2762223 RepID=A0ABR8YTI1_9CLOT|nr:hypothetical protein [Clostridium faecium]MBD8047525.1 hypothetical protein [Clostridium faecium]